MKRRPGGRALSLAAAALAFAAFTAAALPVLRVAVDRDRMRSRNEGEQAMNALFAALRYHDDFGSAIEASPALRARIVGIGAYGGGKLLYSWGAVPPTCEAPAPGGEGAGRPPREYRENPRSRSLVILMGSPERRPPPPPGDDPAEGRARSFMRDTMRDADVTFLELRQDDYWRRRRIASILFPAAEALAAALILAARSLVLRNAGYRRTIEEQRNLVILGTAASTLAHEIKNPLLAIRLQTGILERVCPEAARREIAIIDEEVERLSSLSHRVNDYLRDPAGSPSAVRADEVAREVLERLCGRAPAPPDEPPPPVRMDPDRLRSVLENLLRNALESGGDEADVSVGMSAAGGYLAIDVLDRGRGIGPADAERAFDPFFTTKGRGTGIGLAICRRFVEAAGGSISLEARPGGGARARVSLPLAGPPEGGEP